MSGPRDPASSATLRLRLLVGLPAQPAAIPTVEYRLVRGSAVTPQEPAGPSASSAADGDARVIPLTTTDPAVMRERQARDQMVTLTQRISYWASERRQALRELHEALGTWQKVADATGQKLAAVHKAAKQPKRGTTTP